MTYQLWAVYATGQEELIHEFEHQHEAEFVCNEMNIASTDLPKGEEVPDYRVCEV